MGPVVRVIVTRVSEAVASPVDRSDPAVAGQARMHQRASDWRIRNLTELAVVQRRFHVEVCVQHQWIDRGRTGRHAIAACIRAQSVHAMTFGG
ncbi:hypothetical protein T5B8_05058 [Salinisphaera sp. T5B8]